MSKERKYNDEYQSPEGLTFSQEKLADLLFETPITAKVRRIMQGKHEFYEVTRETRPFDFAQEGEFVQKHHEKYPDAPLSPIYINLRNLPPRVLNQIGGLY